MSRAREGAAELAVGACERQRRPALGPVGVEYKARSQSGAKRSRDRLAVMVTCAMLGRSSVHVPRTKVGMARSVDIDTIFPPQLGYVGCSQCSWNATGPRFKADKQCGSRPNRVHVEPADPSGRRWRVPTPAQGVAF